MCFYCGTEKELMDISDTSIIYGCIKDKSERKAHLAVDLDCRKSELFLLVYESGMERDIRLSRKINYCPMCGRKL